jgi:hypothetical protein
VCARCGPATSVHRERAVTIRGGDEAPGTDSSPCKRGEYCETGRMTSQQDLRLAELGAFLKARRMDVSPEDVGLLHADRTGPKSGRGCDTGARIDRSLKEDKPRGRPTLLTSALRYVSRPRPLTNLTHPRRACNPRWRSALRKYRPIPRRSSRDRPRGLTTGTLRSARHLPDHRTPRQQLEESG